MTSSAASRRTPPTCKPAGDRLFSFVLLIVPIALGLSAGCSDGGGGGGGGGRSSSKEILAAVNHWNQVTIDASGLDHTPVPPGDPRIFGEQVGPCRAARAVAIVHIAIFEAVNAAEGGFESYTGIPRATKHVSLRAAIAQAAHDTLVELWPSQEAAFDDELADELDEVGNGGAKTNGVALGASCAASILALRANDGSDHPEPLYGIDYIASDAPGKWRQDPISLIPLALGARWNEVAPFVMTSELQFRAPPPPALGSAEYAAAYDQVKALGGDGITTVTARTDEQTFIGTYWGYDGTPSLCAPPRLYNQIARLIAEQLGSDGVELARLLALVNVAMADAGLAVWDSKYFYEYWRPVAGIREADPGTGPSGLGDGNAATVGDPLFSPLGAPASNTAGPNFTPPFPAYPSGHAGFGGALFQILRTFYGVDDVIFTFTSDEYNGTTVDIDGNVRPLEPRTFTSFSEAEEENGESRIFLGIHWVFDKDEGILQGRQVADWVFDHIYRPAP